MAEVKWIKLAVNIFDNRKIKQIEKMPEGDALIVVWLKLLILAGNTNDSGLVYFTREIPYTEQLLSVEFNRPLPIIQLALATFKKFGMIDVVEDVIHISNWEKYQNIEGMDKIREQNRIRQKNWYDRQKALRAPNEKPNVRGNVMLTQHNATDKDIEEDIDIEEDNTTGGTAVADKVVAYASLNLRYVSPNNVEELVGFRDKLTDDMITWAIDEACANGNRSYSYVRSICNRMVDSGFRTLGEVKAAEEARRKSKGTKEDEDAEKRKSLILKGVINL